MVEHTPAHENTKGVATGETTQTVSVCGCAIAGLGMRQKARYLKITKLKHDKRTEHRAWRFALMQWAEDRRLKVAAVKQEIAKELTE